MNFGVSGRSAWNSWKLITINMSIRYVHNYIEENEFARVEIILSVTKLHVIWAYMETMSPGLCSFIFIIIINILFYFIIIIFINIIWIMYYIQKNYAPDRNSIFSKNSEWFQKCLFNMKRKPLQCLGLNSMII